MPRSRYSKDGADEGGELAFYMAEARKHKVMTREEERTLAYAARTGGPEGMAARNEFVKRNMRLVVTIARKYTSDDMPLPDLVQEGNIGLMRALDKFDPDRGKFSTYASWWVRQAVTRAIHNAGFIRLPPYIVTAYYRLLRAECRAAHPLTPEETQALTGLSPGMVQRLRSLPTAVSILDAPINSENEVLVVDTVADSGHRTPEREIELMQFRAEVEAALQDASPRDREILLAWIGGDTTLEELGQDAGVTRERVRQILLRVLGYLRRKVKT